MDLKDELILIGVSLTASRMRALELMREEDEEPANVLLDLCEEITGFSNRIGKLAEQLESGEQS